MANEQILWWICQNQLVYLQNEQRKILKMIDNDLRTAFKVLITQIGQVITRQLIEGETVHVKGIASFLPNLAIEVDKRTPKFYLAANLQKLHSSTALLRKAQQEQSCRKLQREVGSFLNIPGQSIQSLVLIFSRAVADLLKSVKSIEIDFCFCVLKISQHSSGCLYRSDFLKQFRGQKKNRKAELSRYLFSWKDNGSNESKQNRQWNKCWQQVKGGNLHDLPSLKEIKNHLDKGFQLEMKYKKLDERRGLNQK